MEPDDKVSINANNHFKTQCTMEADYKVSIITIDLHLSQ